MRLTANIYFSVVQYLLQRKMHHFRIRKIAQKYFAVETAKPPMKSGVSWAISFSLPIDGPSVHNGLMLDETILFNAD